MKCTDEELEERKQKQKEAQKRINEKIAAYEKARLANFEKEKAAAKPKKAAGK